MISSIREIREVSDETKLRQLELQFHTDLDQVLAPLLDLLDKNVRSDYTDIDTHMFLVERWRARLVRYLALATAFVQHAKSDIFLRKKEKGVTDTDREAHVKSVSAGFQAAATLLEGLVECIDSRVNLCKKTVDVEGNGARYGRQTPQAA